MKIKIHKLRMFSFKIKFLLQLAFNSDYVYSEY